MLLRIFVLFQWNDNVNINYPAEYEIGESSLHV